MEIRRIGRMAVQGRFSAEGMAEESITQSNDIDRRKRPDLHTSVIGGLRSMKIETRRRLDVMWIAGLAGILFGLMILGIGIIVVSFLDDPAPDHYPQIFPSTTVRTITVEQREPAQPLP